MDDKLGSCFFFKLGFCIFLINTVGCTCPLKLGKKRTDMHAHPHGLPSCVYHKTCLKVKGNAPAHVSVRPRSTPSLNLRPGRATVVADFWLGLAAILSLPNYYRFFCFHLRTGVICWSGLLPSTDASVAFACMALSLMSTTWLHALTHMLLIPYCVIMRSDY